MNRHDYQRQAARTAPTHLSDQERRENAAHGLIGEYGELLDLLKKQRWHGHDDRSKLTDEFGDVCWYIAEVCTILGVDMPEPIPEGRWQAPTDVYDLAVDIALLARDVVNYDPCSVIDCTLGDLANLMRGHGLTLDAVLTRNIAKLQARYPEGFTEARSIGRADK
jgi:NTP pyrophosphatase (non-canonical NTP hydrolase)